MRGRFGVMALTAVAVLLAVPSLALGVTRYATPTPSPGADCATSTSACSLETAFGPPTAAGDTVVALPGTYTAGGMASPPPGVSLVGQPGSRPVVKIPVNGFLSLKASTPAATLSNLDIEVAPSAILSARGSVTVSHVVVNETYSGPTPITGFQLEEGATLADSTIRSTGGGGVSVTGGGPVPVSRLVNDTVYASGSGAVAVDVQSGCNFITTAPITAHASLSNVIAYGEAAGLQTSKSTFAPCAIPASDLVVDHSNFNGVNSANGAPTDGGGNQVVPALTDPAALFVSPPADLHEKAGAATIDAGSGSGSGLEATDLDGSPRVQGGGVDMGAYETVRAQTTSTGTTPASSTTPPVPVLTGLGLAPHRLVATGRKVKGRCVKPTARNRHARHCKLKLQLKLSYTLNTPASLRLLVQLKATGRTVKGKCVKQTKRNRKRKACQLRPRTVRTITITGKAGANTTPVILGNLKPGSYQLAITPSASGKTGKATGAGFTVGP